jgi:hypothetical protein
MRQDCNYQLETTKLGENCKKKRKGERKKQKQMKWGETLSKENVVFHFELFGLMITPQIN